VETPASENQALPSHELSEFRAKCGLFVRTPVKLKNVDTGFDTRNVLLFGLNPTKSGYKEATLNDFFFRVCQRLTALPGVESATASFHEPINDGRRGRTLRVPGLTLPPDQMDVAVMPAGPRFFGDDEDSLASQS